MLQLTAIYKDVVLLQLLNQWVAIEDSLRIKRASVDQRYSNISVPPLNLLQQVS